MNDKNPFESILELQPIKADLKKKTVSDVSYSDIVEAASDWLPSEIIQAFKNLQSAEYKTTDMAQSLSIILALLRGELRTKAAIKRWFSTGQVEFSHGQTAYLSTIGRLARDILRISNKLDELSELKKEKEAAYQESSGKKAERAGDAIDRVEKSIASFEEKREKAASEFDQLLKIIADYLGVGRMK